MTTTNEFSDFIEQFRVRAARRLSEFEAEMEKTRAASMRAMQMPREEAAPYGSRPAPGPVQSVLRKRRL
ncbi:hypothetical protein [Corynebacterium freiburgense]|uniref:hypothetical protein n=1 Tax=Corynebacterium freiburgense TaxID=556548 RepID=UPI00047BC7EF|nr:hypothetical protein [Corynebacterium freiburgense]